MLRGRRRGAGGRAGSAEGVPLLVLAESFALDRELWTASRRAAREIQSRLGDVEAGRASLDEGEERAGWVSAGSSPDGRSKP